MINVDMNLIQSQEKVTNEQFFMAKQIKSIETEWGIYASVN